MPTRTASSKVTPPSTEAVADATDAGFLQHNTTPQERASIQPIGEHSPGDRDTAGAQGQATEPIGPHPWLSVEERARVRDD